jgi:hypothetical protein
MKKRYREYARRPRVVMWVHTSYYDFCIPAE